MQQRDDYGYVNGFVERKQGGRYEGKVSVEGIDLSPIVGVYFKRGNKSFLWIKRKKILEYDNQECKFTERERKPMFECYLEKQIDNKEDIVAYKGEFFFMRFRFSIVGVWDRILGHDEKQRLNLYVERLPMAEQTIINGINKRKNDNTI